jgi:hypothetical protein
MKLSDRLLISSPYEKIKFRGLGSVKAQNCLSKMHRPLLYRLQYQCAANFLSFAQLAKRKV